MLHIHHGRAWSADGSTSTSATAMPATTATSGISGFLAPQSGCTTCQKKRMACLGAGILLGVVATLLLTIKSA